MTTARTLAKNATVLMIAQVISIAVTLFYLSYSGKYLGVENFGVLGFALSFTNMFAYFADFGFGTLTIMKVARDRSLASKYFGNMLILRIILSIVLFFAMVLAINLMGSPDETIQVVYVIAASTLLFVLNGAINCFFQAFEKMEYQSLGTGLFSVVMLVGTFYAIWNDLGIMGFAFVNLAANLVVICYSTIVCLALVVRPKLEADPEFLRSNVMGSLPFGLAGFLQTIFYSFDAVLLFNMQGQEVVGWYSASARLVHYLQVIPLMINIAVFPAMSRFYVSSQDQLKLIYEKYFKIMLIIAIPMGVGTTILADKIILSIYGDGFAQSTIAMQVLIWSVVISFAYATFLQLFNTTNHQRLTTAIIALGMVVNLALNVIMIPAFSYVGSSFALVITELSILVVSLYYAVKLGYGIRQSEIVRILLKVVAASIAMAIFLLYFIDLNLLILVPVAMTVYFGVLYVVGGVDDDDKMLVRSILKGI